MVELEIPKSHRKRLVSTLRKFGDREVGGVLLGEQLSPLKFRLVGFSVDSISGSLAHFPRSVDCHVEVLEEFYQETGFDYGRFNYLGEWHSHPGYSVTPSLQDFHSMIELVKSESQIDFSLLLITNLKWKYRLRANAIMFSSWGDPAEVKLTY